MIKVNNFTKNYDNVQAVKSISFEVKKGAFFALLGPNGAGKSTTIETLATLLGKDAGDLYINGYEIGKDDAKIRQSIGLVFQYSVLDFTLTGKENLMIRGAFYGLSNSDIKHRIDALDQLIGFKAFYDQKVKTLSGGQKRKLDIARALIHTPELLMLDEPTTGLDPKSRKDIWSLIMTLKQSTNMTLLLTTHYMEEVADADHVIIMHQGSIIAEDTADALRRKHAQDHLKLYPKTDLIEILKQNNIQYVPVNQTIHIKINDAFEGIKIVENFKTHIHSFEIIKASLDDVFLNLTGEAFEVVHHA